MEKRFKEIREQLNPENAEWLTKSELKIRLQTAYDKAGIMKTANASDVQIFFDTVERQRRVEGKQTGGYLFIKEN